MQNAAVFKLFFDAPLHLGTAKNDMDESARLIHSDALYAAFFHAWAVLGGKMDDLADEHGLPRGFALSSAFPFFGSTLFFPIPKHGLEKPKDDGKAFDSVRFVDAALFQKFQKTGSVALEKDFLRASVAEKQRREEFATAEKAVPSAFVFSKIYPRVRVPRERGETEPEPYYIERLFFADGAGLFFLCFFDDEKAVRRLESALAYLGDEGLGTDRHVGNGLFRFEKTAFPIADFQAYGAEFGLNLSLFLPEKEGFSRLIEDERTSFELMKRGGWMTLEGALGIRKNAVRMLREGGIFKTEKNVLGRSENLRPDLSFVPKTPVWRTGRSVFLPVDLKK